MNLVHLAYLGVLFVAWVWGVSQAAYAVRAGWQWPPAWRTTAAVWLVAKAVFLTYVGYFTWHDMPGHGLMVGIFFLIHLVAFLQWWRLPTEAKPVAEPPLKEV